MKEIKIKSSRFIIPLAQKMEHDRFEWFSDNKKNDWMIILVVNQFVLLSCRYFPNLIKIKSTKKNIAPNVNPAITNSICNSAKPGDLKFSTIKTGTANKEPNAVCNIKETPVEFSFVFAIFSDT